MAKKPLSDKVCQGRLTRWIERNYSERLQNVIAYHNDIVREDSYSFRYDLPTGANRLLTIDRQTESITEVSANEKTQQFC